jgi:hypothetical protein
VGRYQWRSLTTDETIEAALDWLEDEDWLCSKATGGTGPGSGRRTRVTALIPRSREAQRGWRLNWLDRARREIQESNGSIPRSHLLKS